jgi:hypothetical protein
MICKGKIITGVISLFKDKLLQIMQEVIGTYKYIKIAIAFYLLNFYPIPFLWCDREDNPFLKHGFRAQRFNPSVYKSVDIPLHKLLACTDNALV